MVWCRRRGRGGRRRRGERGGEKEMKRGGGGERGEGGERGVKRRNFLFVCFFFGVFFEVERRMGETFILWVF